MLTEAIEIRDERFHALVLYNVHLEKLATGMRWCEGPAYFPAGRYLLWSDIPNDRVMRYDESDDSVSVFQTPCGHHNGHTVDRAGRLLSCEHSGRCVSRIEHDGARTILADSFEGRRLNSPNDIVVKSDGSIWFTDPTYGIDSDYQGNSAPSEHSANHVFRLDAETRDLSIVAADFVQPNGLAFSPDEKLLYIADTGISHRARGPRHIRVFEMSADGKSIENGRVFATCTAGVFDGFRCDTQGHIWTSAADGVHCYHADGTLLGKIRVPEVVANLCFGGRKRNRLFICACTSLYAIYVNARGATWPAASAP
jgi:gluconolactonase